MDISAPGFLIAACSLLLACIWLLHLDHLQNIFVSCWKLLFRRGIAANLPLPPGSFGLPWLGETLQLIGALQAGDLLHFHRHRTARFGSKTFKTHIFLKPTVIFQGASANRFLATNENQHLLVTSWSPATLRIVGFHAPLAQHGAAHRRLRHIMASCLCPAALQKLVGKADLLTRHHFASYWKGHSNQLCLVPLLKLHTFRVSCSLLASIDDKATVDRLYPLFNTLLEGIAALPVNLPYTTYRKAINARNLLVQEMGEIIHRREQDLAHLEQGSSNMEPLQADILKESRSRNSNDNTPTSRGFIGLTTEQSNDVATEHTFSFPKAEQGSTVASSQKGNVDIGNTYTQDLLSMLIKARDENGGSLNREELQDVLLFMLFAGHDTTNATLIFALKFLEQNPTCFDSLVKEHEAIASQKSAGDEELKWTDVQEMKYTWRVIQETIRLIPPAFGGTKEVKQEITFDGYRIPQGWNVFFSPATTHHDEKYFLEPRKFDPSRFDTKKREEKLSFPPFTYVPFGIGPHSCPGNNFARMTTSIYLHHLALEHFIWTSIEPNEKVTLFPMPTLAKDYPVKVTKKLS